MLSSFTAVPSAHSAKSSGHPGSPKVEVGGSADSTPFHEVLAGKSPQAMSLGKSTSHAPSNRKRAEPDAAAPNQAKAADAKPADQGVHRRSAKAAAKAEDSACCQSKADQGKPNENEANTGEPSTTREPTSELSAEASAETEALAPEDVLLMGVPQTAPLVPLTVGLPTLPVSTTTPQPEPVAEWVAEADVLAEISMVEGNVQASAEKQAYAKQLALGLGHARAEANHRNDAVAAMATDTTSGPLAAIVREQGQSTPAEGTEVLDGEVLPSSGTTLAGSDAALAEGLTTTVGGAASFRLAANAERALALARQSADAYGHAAQIAGVPSSSRSQAHEMDVMKNNNMLQVAVSERDSDVGELAGIQSANELSSMTPTAPTFLSPLVVNATVQTLGPSDSKAAPSLESTAVRMVERVSEVADHLATHPSEQVTVRIDLDETHRVDVHVSMRGGQVHADFRSDSADMRAALASAWNQFSQGREGAERRWAEPAFTSMPSASNTATPTDFNANLNSSAGSSGSGQDSARRQAAEREVIPQWSGIPNRTAVNAPVVAETKSSSSRSENSQHLSVLA